MNELTISQCKEILRDVCGSLDIRESDAKLTFPVGHRPGSFGIELHSWKGIAHWQLAKLMSGFELFSGVTYIDGCLVLVFGDH
jgi:hypothetical protein